MISAFQILSSEKSVRTMSLTPSWMVYDRVQARRNDGGFKVRQNATRRKETNFVGPTSFARIEEKEAAKRFSAAVIDFDAHTLARISGRSVEAAKLWKAGIRCPNGSSLINLGAIITEVQAWIDGEMEYRRPRIQVDPKSAGEQYARLHAKLQQEALEPGERGARAREMLNDLRSI